MVEEGEVKTGMCVYVVMGGEVVEGWRVLVLMVPWVVVWVVLEEVTMEVEVEVEVEMS